MKTIEKIIEQHGGLTALKKNYIRIENDPCRHKRCLLQAAVESGVIGQNRAGANHHGIAMSPQPVNGLPRPISGNPLR